MCFSVQIDRDIQKISNRFKAEISKKYFDEFENMQFADAKKYKWPGDDGRIFPNVFAPVITSEDDKLLLRPMRYRLRPEGSNVEVPAKFNLYNARVDSLEGRQSWQSLFGIKHCILPFKSFYEWVEKDAKRKLINFIPTGHDFMWAAGLYDSWISEDQKRVIHSFAVITGNAPKEIVEKGHSRCPIFINESHLGEWLSPEGKSKKELYSLLDKKESVVYQNHWV